MLETQYVTRTEWRKHVQAPPLMAHGIWNRIKQYVPGWGYSQAEINAFFEGYDGGKAQVHWDRVTGKPGTFPPSAHTLASHSSKAHSELTGVTSDLHHAQLHASAHQVGGGDPLNNLLLGASPYIKWQSGHLLLQTDEGTNTNTYIDIKGKGTGVGTLRTYDADDAEWVEIYETAGYGYFKTAGSSPHPLRMMHNVAQNVSLWELITAGNPNFDIHGWQAGIGVKYGRQWVATDGVYNLQGEVGLRLNFASFYLDTFVANNKVYDSARLNGQLGSYYAPTTTKLDDWATPDDNIDLNASISRHGLFPKLSNHAAQCYSGIGQWLTLYDSTSIVICILSKTSTTTRNSNDTERTTTAGSYTKLKETKLGEPTGVMSIQFTLESVGGETVYGRIYKNGSPIGTAHSTTTIGTWAQDLGGFDSQDLIQIYAYAELEDTAKVRNMRFRYDRSINILGECTLTTPIAITTQVPFSMQNQDP
ncbi:MAG: hypothetical protein KAV87_31835 [Desulfobacteraceae bacterium]|nr:hypothetical protein [Desulfobacteraceae bacterium]